MFFDKMFTVFNNREKAKKLCDKTEQKLNKNAKNSGIYRKKNSNFFSKVFFFSLDI